MPTDDLLAAAEQILAEGRPDQAVKILESMIQSGRAGMLTRLMYARALGEAGEAAKALDAARETALLHPAVAVAALSLGAALLRKGLLPAAISEFQRALRIDPVLIEARYQLGCAWLEAGEPHKALLEFAGISPELASHNVALQIARAEQMQTAPRSNANYVRHLFDQFSADYDSRMLTQLGYSAPRILGELLSFVAEPTRPHSLRILDLGCGTGLAGAEFRDVALVLDGIDLSPSMLEKARARGIYDSLRTADIESWIAAPASYGLVIAADTLVYLGDLATVFARVHAALVDGGYFLFTVEANGDSGFDLGPKRRWRHAQSYVREQARRIGFDVRAIVKCSPRTEAGVPVEGFAIAFEKPKNV